MAKAIKDDINIFAKRLNELIKERKLVHEDIAQGIGVTRQGVGKWVSGDSVPDVLTVAKLARFFNVSVDYLAGNSDPDVRTADTEPQAICKYTGLNDKAVEKLHEYYAIRDQNFEHEEYIDGETCEVTRDIGYEFKKIFAVMNELISEGYLYELARNLSQLKEDSQAYIDTLDLINAVENSSPESSKHAKEKLEPSTEKQLKYRKYDLFEFIIRLSDHFDQREQVTDNGKHQTPKK